MFKTLALAALVGAASATVTTNQWTLFTASFPAGASSPYYSCGMKLAFDAGYGTQYNPKMGPMTPQPDNSETYAFNIFSWVKVSFNHEIMSSYMANYDFKLDVLDFTPYGQTVTWSRFDAGNGFSASTSAFHDIEILNFNTRVIENAKTCMWSAFNNVDWQPTCAYNADRQTDYMDPVW